MARRSADAPPRNEFEAVMSSKVVDSEFLSLRWGKGVRRIDQLRSNPKQLHIDAIRGIPKRRKKTPAPEILSAVLVGRNEFENIMYSKGLSPGFLSKRWGLGKRRINQIRSKPETLHVDAIKGIPKYRKRIIDRSNGSQKVD